MRRLSVGSWLALATVMAGCTRARPARPPLRVAVPYETATLDPHLENKLANWSLLSNVYEPLVDMDADMRLRPRLAERWETTDATTWVFHLRKGVVFDDGRPLRAADVVATVERLQRDPGLQMRSYLVDVTEVAAVGEDAVRVRTMRPEPALAARLAFVAIVPEGAIDLAVTAHGTGPYTVAAWTPGVSLTLRRNERYWGPSPAVAQADITLGRDADAARAGLLAGQLDLVQSDARVVAAAGAGEHFEVLRHGSIYVKYLGFDVARQVTPFCAQVPNPFRDRRVRQALDLALDRKALVAALPSEAEPATQPVPRFIFGFVPNLPENAPDPERARQLLADAGYAKGLDVTLHTRLSLLPGAETVRKQLAAIGVRIDVRALRDPDFFDLLDRGGASLWLSRWGAPTGDAGELFEMYVHSPDRVKKLGQLNHGGYANVQIDRQIEELTGGDVAEGRLQSLQQIMRQVLDDRVLVPLYADRDVYVVQRAYSYTPRSDSALRLEAVRLR